ncbi:MAG: gluconokinase [Actinomycetota bacterium]|nr:gluconokinase [Actinomycetota bacterium]
MRAVSPVHLVVMGVSGTGKTTVAAALVERLGWPCAEGDDFHPESNLTKMRSGRPLTDEDRLPWLEMLAAWTADQHAKGMSTVLTCSALRRGARDLLRSGADGTSFCHLAGDKHELLGRMQGREHFFPPELLESQLDTLQPLAPDEDGFVLDSAAPVTDLVEAVLDQLARRGHPSSR